MYKGNARESLPRVTLPPHSQPEPLPTVIPLLQLLIDSLDATLQSLDRAQLTPRLLTFCAKCLANQLLEKINARAPVDLISRPRCPPPSTRTSPVCHPQQHSHLSGRSSLTQRQRRLRRWPASLLGTRKNSLSHQNVWTTPRAARPIMATSTLSDASEVCEHPCQHSYPPRHLSWKTMTAVD